VGFFERINGIENRIQEIQTRITQLGGEAVAGRSTGSFAQILASQMNQGSAAPAQAASSGAADYQAYIQEAAEKYNVDPNLIKAVIHQESGGNAQAVSPCGAMGLMQLMPATAKSVGVEDAYDPRQNIMGGTRYLKGLLERFNDNYTMALAAYNAGPGAVNQYGGVPPYRETQNYVASVLGHYQKLSRGDG